MYAVIGNPQPDFGPNASALVIRPVPIGHHGIVFRVIDHISVAVVVAGAGRLRLNGIGKPLRFYPMHSVAGGNDGRVFVDGDPHHVGRINGPIAIAVPRFFQDNYVRVSHLIIGMRTVAVIGGKILISGGPCSMRTRWSLPQAPRLEITGPSRVGPLEAKQLSFDFSYPFYSSFVVRPYPVNDA